MWLLLGMLLHDTDELCSQAAVQASREGAKAVTLKHFEWAKVCFSVLVKSDWLSLKLPS